MRGRGNIWGNLHVQTSSRRLNCYEQLRQESDEALKAPSKMVSAIRNGLRKGMRSTGAVVDLGQGRIQ